MNPIPERAPRLGLIVRSFLFNVFFYGWTGVLCLLALPILFGPATAIARGQTLWARGILLAARGLVGIRYHIRGREHLLAGQPVILAARHESAWDTIVFLAELPGCAYVIKKELLSIPLYGRFCRSSGMIAVDRSGGMAALRTLVADARDRLLQGRSLVIFPQGTRVAAGIKAPYLPGIAALYSQCDVPVLPVALNSGRCWGRHRFLKQPGIITVDLLAPLPAGLKRGEMMAMLEARIESAYDRLP